MPIKLANNASGTLATAISASDTGIALTTGDGAEFPALAAGEYFYLTLTAPSGAFEIVKATARVGDAVTVVRAQEGTTAIGFPVGSRAELKVTAQSVEDYVEQYAELGTYTPAGVNAVVRTVETKLRETVSVKDFGAVGDGVADDTAAIQAALDSGATRVYGPGGTYLTGSLTIPSNVELYGDGAATVFKLKPAANATVIRNSNQSGGNVNITLRDIAIDGNKANNTAGSCVSFVKVTGFKLQNVKAYDSDDHVFALTEVTRGQVLECSATGAAGATMVGLLLGASYPSTTNAVDVEVRGGYYANNGQDGVLFEAGSNVRIIGVTANSNGQTGVKIGSTASRYIVANCYTEGNITGFKSQQASNGEFVGNIAYRNLQPGFSVETSFAGTVTGILIANNQAIENGQGISAQYGFQVYPSISGATASRIVLIGNISRGHSRGFSFQSVAGATIEDLMLLNNYAENNTVNFFESYSGTTNTVVRSNNINGRGEASSSSAVTDGLGQSYDRLRFSYDDVAAFSGVQQMQNAFANTRGYVVAKEGFIKSFAARISEAVTANSIIVRLQRNGVDLGDFNLIFDGATLFKRDQENYNIATYAVAAGDVLTASVQGNGALTPTTIDVEAVIEVGY